MFDRISVKRPRGERNRGRAVGSRLGGCFHDLAGTNQVNGAHGIARSELESAIDDLGDVGGRAELIVVLDVLTDDAALVSGVLQPVDELIAAAGELPVLGHRRQPGEDEHRYPVAGSIVDGAGERLGAAVDVDEDGLGATAELSVAVGAAQRHHLVRAGDDIGNAAAGDPRFGDGLDDGGMVAAEIRKYVRDTGPV